MKIEELWYSLGFFIKFLLYFVKIKRIDWNRKIALFAIFKFQFLFCWIFSKFQSPQLRIINKKSTISILSFIKHSKFSSKSLTTCDHLKINLFDLELIWSRRKKKEEGERIRKCVIFIRKISHLHLHSKDWSNHSKDPRGKHCSHPPHSRDPEKSWFLSLLNHSLNFESKII